MDRVLARLRRTGAPVVIATQASTAPALLGTLTTGQQGRQDESFDRLNRLLLQFAARHPGEVTLVDLATRVCPDGPPCAEEVDGIALRPVDGGHFSPAGGVWASEWLLPQLLAAGETATPGA
jgi:lysophospholipase L1-like esterase